MRQGIMIVAAVALLCAGGLAHAQDWVPWTFLQADKIIHDAPARTPPVLGTRTLTGNVVFEVNGVVVRADRVVMKEREVSLEGNVRLTLPQPK